MTLALAPVFLLIAACVIQAALRLRPSPSAFVPPDGTQTPSPAMSRRAA